MTSKLVQANTIKEGSYVIIDGAPCRVTNVQISKTGKHGAAKVRMVGIGIIDEKKREVVMPGSDNIEVPIIEKKSAQILSITNDVANVMDTESYETFDLVIPDELKGKLSEGMQVLYWEVMGQRVMKQIKG